MNGCWVYECMGVNPRKKQGKTYTPENKVWMRYTLGKSGVHVCISRCVFPGVYSRYTLDFQVCMCVFPGVYF